ncbi:hypothetical protein [Plantactinospora sp. CA-290183]|uniref:hypothetical protein n=1 Tax=Plantactinospora sp. CA-290183 TaxID=3240006 RepID=UPI003D927594
MLRSPLRGIDASYRRQSGCGSNFAIVVVDFEPAGAYEFVDAAPGRVPAWASDWASDPDHLAHLMRGHDDDVREYKRLLTDAMRADLGRSPVRVVLTRFAHHEVDSNERGFAVAARRAVRELHRRVPLRLTAPVRGVHARDSGTYARGRGDYFSEITVDFEPADAYEFVNRADPRRVYPEVVDEVVRAEIGPTPVRVILTGGGCDNVDEDRFAEVVPRALPHLRAHLTEDPTTPRPAEAPPAGAPPARSA